MLLTSSSQSSGMRTEFYTDRVFAGLALVVIIGLLVESPGFATVERLTVHK